MVAQDTGGAIIGPARADIYLGAGAEAGIISGRFKNPGRFTMLFPNEIDPFKQLRDIPLPRPRPKLPGDPKPEELVAEKPAPTPAATAQPEKKAEPAKVAVAKPEPVKPAAKIEAKKPEPKAAESKKPEAKVETKKTATLTKPDQKKKEAEAKKPEVKTEKKKEAAKPEAAKPEAKKPEKKADAKSKSASQTTKPSGPPIRNE